MKYHILNGDALAEQLSQTSLQGEFIVARECLLEGNVQADSWQDFWEMRAEYIADSYEHGAHDYKDITQAEFEKIKQIPENASVYLWFERDLFCQVNLWFTVNYIEECLGAKHFYLFLVLPNHPEWTGFGALDKDELMQTFEQKYQLKRDDVCFFQDLWKAYQQQDFDTLKQRSVLMNKRYPYLDEVVDAHLARFSENGQLNRPEQSIKNIIQELETEDFGAVFREFSKREGIYGFGDLQFKKMYDKIMQKP